jgi:hypothetical protein
MVAVDERWQNGPEPGALDVFMRIGLRCFALLPVVLMAPSSAWPKSVEFAFNEVTVSIDVPPNMEVRRRSLGPIDFLLYDVVSQGASLLGIYLGNWPQKPDVPKEKFRKAGIAGCEAYFFERRENGGASRDVFVLLRPPSGSPQVVHFFYSTLTATRARQADAIVESLTPIKGAGCRR